MEAILITGDIPSQLQLTERVVREKLGYLHVLTTDSQEAMGWLRSPKQPPLDLLLLDLPESGKGGLDFVRAAKACRPQLPILVLVPYGGEDKAVQMVHAGADDFLIKPVTIERMRLSIQHILQRERMSHYIARLERHTNSYMLFSDIVGRNPVWMALVAKVQQVAFSRMPVWLEGERGTGKECLARAMHSSGRPGTSFIMIDGGTFSGGRMEFATKLREAERGTLFIRDVEMLNAQAQQALLTILEQGQGARIICSATLNMPGNFNQALMRILKSACFTLPPLRDRKDDIPLLATHFIAIHTASENKTIRGLTDYALELLAAGSWPGNVRQLSNLIWRAVLLCNGDMLDAGDIRLIQQLQPVHYSSGNHDTLLPMLFDMDGRMKKLKSIEEDAIRFALHYSGGCMTRAAKNLGIGRSTLYRRVSELGVDGQISRANHTTRPMTTASVMERS